MTMKIPHPIPYQGSKRRIAPMILSYFPEGVDTLIEPFAGSAAVSIAALANAKTQRVALNDLNKPLMNLWKTIIEEPKKLSNQYRQLWNAQTGKERTFYDQIRNQFNKEQKPDYFLYLLARCVKASVRYNAQGDFNQSPDNRRRGAHPNTIAAHVLGASSLLQNRTTLYSQDFTNVALKATPKDLVYMDPPYQGVSGKRDARYIKGVEVQEFAALLEQLNRRHISFIVSYDGQCGTKKYGQLLPSSLNLSRIDVPAGPSSQATLLGRRSMTTESLYLSRALLRRLKKNNVMAEEGKQAEEEFVFAR